MSKAKDFQYISDIAAIRLAEKSVMVDYELMMALKFSPFSWKTWKPLLIQYLTSQSHELALEKERHKYKVTYDKKQKIWNCTVVDNT